ncbi:MAG: cobalamin-dependent protein [Arhodomonas sp.]|nr:cobalamin-dependent protein [Arhodomonas sp.]
MPAWTWSIPGCTATPEEVVDAALQEDVDILGISLLSGVHMDGVPRVLELLREKGGEDIIVAGGGVIPDEDVAELERMGVAKVLLQDTPPQEIVDSFRALVAERGPR